jgi:hydroxyethylthiazole kinase
MGIAGELAYEQAGELGNGSFHAAIHDAVSKLDGDTFAARANCESTGWVDEGGLHE